MNVSRLSTWPREMKILQSIVFVITSKTHTIFIRLYFQELPALARVKQSDGFNTGI